MSLENASPSRLLVGRPAAPAEASKALLSYQPGVPVEVSEGLRSKETPTSRSRNEGRGYSRREGHSPSSTR